MVIFRLKVMVRVKVRVRVAPGQKSGSEKRSNNQGQHR